MAFNKIMSILGGTFDCTMRDRSEGLCAGVRSKTMTSSRDGLPGSHAATTGQIPDQTPRYYSRAGGQTQATTGQIPEHSYRYHVRPEGMSCEVVEGGPTLYDPAQSLHRLPSPGLSSQSLPSPSHSLLPSDNEDEYLALRALFLCPGQDTEHLPQEKGFPSELPNDFFQKMATLVARDREVQSRMVTGELVVGNSFSIRSRFLQQCVRDNTDTASQLWRRLEVRDKQDLLLAYSCGPPTRDFFCRHDDAT